MLSNPDKRARYDQFGHAGMSGAAGGGAGGFGGFSGGGFSMEDIFSQFGDIFGDPETVEESNLLLDGKEAMQYVFTAKLGETEYKFRQVVCTRNGMAYILTYASTAANYDRHADEVQETIAQFKFMV